MGMDKRLGFFFLPGWDRELDSEKESAKKHIYMFNNGEDYFGTKIQAVSCILKRTIRDKKINTCRYSSYLGIST